MIKSFEEAVVITGELSLDQFQPKMEALYRLTIITKALNGDWKPDPHDVNQDKYYPCFRFLSMSHNTFKYLGCSNNASHIFGSMQLCYKSVELAKHSGETFIDLWKTLLT